MTKKAGFATRAIQINKQFGEKGSLNVPIYQNSTFAQKEPGEWEWYTYTRTGNPTEAALRATLADLESGRDSVVFSSGLAAINGLFEYFEPGDHIISTADIYGGSYRLMRQFIERRGLKISFVESKDTANITDAITDRTKLIYLETPSNPLLEITDIGAVAAAIKDLVILLAVDNTLATPYFQQPLLLGADIVVHSLSKYISGHTNVVGGAIIASDQNFIDRMKFIRKATGANPGPFDCYLTLLGTKTLALRMEKHQQNALALAEFLADHPAVLRVIYPGLKSHPQYELVKSQMSGFSGVITFEISGGAQAAKLLMTDINIFTLSISFGSVASMISYPPKMSHKDMPAEVRLARGFSDGMVRISVGIEDFEDLKNALAQNLNLLR